TCGLTFAGAVRCWGLGDLEPIGHPADFGQARPPGTCGNGRREPSEVCHDGNTIDGARRSADCTSARRCGNGGTEPGGAGDGPLRSLDWASWSECVAPGGQGQKLCPPAGECQIGGGDASLGCTLAPAPDDTPCAGGVCRAGACARPR